MKIIQTCRLGPESENAPWHHTGGWISAEYHWMSWALSCLQLRCFYERVELYADQAAINILIHTLKLPYTKVHLIPDDLHVPEGAWALAKIYIYSQQKTPFLHVDSDVFIWEPFDKSLEKTDLIAQNLERDFDYYHNALIEYSKIFDFIPEALIPGNVNLTSCNAGVLGGSRIDFFQSYSTTAIKFVLENEKYITKIDSSIYCMVFEQLLFYRLSHEKNINISCLINDEITDPTYAGFGDLRDVSFSRKYAHSMGLFKKMPISYQFLAKRLRKDYPGYYYMILSFCQKEGVELENKSYSLSKLNPSKFNTYYFKDLNTNLRNTQTKKMNWEFEYARDAFAYEQIEVIFKQKDDEIMNIVLQFNKKLKIIEITEPHLKQKILIKDINTLSEIETELDNLSMILIDSFLDPVSIVDAIKNVNIYFNSNENSEEYLGLKNLILNKIRNFLQLGILNLLCSKKV